MIEVPLPDGSNAFDEPSSLSLPAACTKVLFIAPNLPELKKIFQTLFLNNLQPIHRESLPELPLHGVQHVFVDLTLPGAIEWLAQLTKAGEDLGPIAFVQRGEREGSALAAGATATLQHPIDATDVLLCVERNRIRVERTRGLQELLDRDRRRIATNSVEGVLTTLCQDLRNPLAAALANVEYLRDTDNRDSIQVNVDEKRNILEDTLEALQRLRITLDSLATLVKREISEARRVVFWEVVQGVLDDIVGDVSLVSLTGDPTVRGWADDELLPQVVSTLVSRAVSSARSSTTAPAVQIRVYATETEARISVRDNGPPLSAEVVKTLFETSDMISGRGSAGLLLAMTHHAVVRMGGVLDYAPRSGPGGVFRIRLRLVHANE